VNGLLVAYEYGSGAAWGFVRSFSSDLIRQHAPDVVIHEEAPSWMSTAELTCLREQGLEPAEVSPERLFAISMEVGSALAG
jgi:hypothetical protein